MRNLGTILFILFFGFQAFSQSASFKLEVSSDSVLLGNIIAVTFALENTQATDVSFPDFVGFSTHSGPNMSTSMSFINGEMTQSMSYTFYLEPLSVGDAYIEPAGIETDAGYLETLPFLVRVYPNPDGIIQHPNKNSGRSDMFDFFGDSPFGNDPIDRESLRDGFLKEFFADPNSSQPDTLIQQPKKRKTTRI